MVSWVCIIIDRPWCDWYLSGTPRRYLRRYKCWEKFSIQFFNARLNDTKKQKTRTSTYVVKLLGCSCLTSSNICDVSRVSACENPLRLFYFKSRYLGCRVSKKRKREESNAPKKTLAHSFLQQKKIRVSTQELQLERRIMTDKKKGYKQQNIKEFMVNHLKSHSHRTMHKNRLTLATVAREVSMMTRQDKTRSGKTKTGTQSLLILRLKRTRWRRRMTPT